MTNSFSKLQNACHVLLERLSDYQGWWSNDPEVVEALSSVEELLVEPSSEMVQCPRDLLEQAYEFVQESRPGETVWLDQLEKLLWPQGS